MSLESDMMMPKFMRLSNGGLCWPEPHWPGLPKGSKEMSLARYNELKSWPDSPVFKAWVEENKPHEIPLKFILDRYNRELREIATANNFDGYGGVETTPVETRTKPVAAGQKRIFEPGQGIGYSLLYSWEQKENEDKWAAVAASMKAESDAKCARLEAKCARLEAKRSELEAKRDAKQANREAERAELEAKRAAKRAATRATLENKHVVLEY